MSRPEFEIVQELFKNLTSKSIERHKFPKKREKWNVPSQEGACHGVYLIRKGELVQHVGRTIKGKKGLFQRLKNHVSSASSFVNATEGLSEKLRNSKAGYTFSYVVIDKTTKGIGDSDKAARLRALLEAYAIGRLCPAHIGLGYRPESEA